MYSLAASSNMLARVVPRRVVTKASADAAPAAPKARKKAPLDTGGTLKGSKMAGKAAGAAALAELQGREWKMGSETVFADSRWVEGCWDFDQFKSADGEVEWNAVVDAEVRRRKILEDYPTAGDTDFPVTFDLSMIPTKVWVTRFHLPEAEQINGRAAMIGLVAALLVDKAFHISIADQFDSFPGKILLLATVVGCAFIRKNEDVDNLKGLADEATFYDRQWKATWDGVDRPGKEE